MTSPVTPDEPESARTERLAIAAAARLEGEVSRLRTELAACSEAFEARGDLSTAWEAAEAALPEGWHMGELKNTSYRGVNPNGESERWLAMAWAENDERTFEHGYGDSPVLALAALTARLQARSTEQGGAG